MIFPSNFEQKLGFDVIRQNLSSCCLSTLGKEKIRHIYFSTDAREIAGWLKETDEMMHILQFEEGFPSQDYYDMLPELVRIRIPGTFMETDQLAELRLSLMTIADLISFIQKREEKFPVLAQLIAGWHPPFFRSFAEKIHGIINEKADVRDNASPELTRIRRVREVLQASVEKQMLQHFRHARQNGWIPDDAEVTIRNGRLVIPMTSTHKRKITGFVHDESATGHTVFVEPSEVFETNNEIRELDYAERREIIRILMALASELRPEIDALLQGFHILGTFDAIRAKALFAMDIHAVRPIHLPGQEKAGFKWRGAIHPLLFLSHRKVNKQVVPLDISLTESHRILLISGPNAGGKSVCLKTTGLIQYMFQCGLLPPVKEDSEFCIFHKLFIDIGDEQSIDNDLSTYSSKLLNLKFFLENTDPRTLFLIDEFGTGTDPSLGGAIAEAALEALNRTGALGVVTTHYSNLKLLAGREQGIINGAMLYDLQKLRPLYQLKTGHPGSSFALEIAQEIGFPEEVLKIARAKTGTSQLDFDRELQTLEVEKQQLVKQQQEVKIADDFLAEVIAKYEKNQAELESKRKEIIDKARQEAKALLDKVNSTIERTIREIRESQAEKNRTRELRAELEEVKETVNRELIQSKPVADEPKPENFVESKPFRSRQNEYIRELNTRLTNYQLTLDLRGKRVDEAVGMLQRYIDDAVMFGIPEVRILHGKGNGVLRQVSRDYLRSQKEVRSAKDAPVEQGGAGITVVTFRT
jgi:DNA mismatch repair protein MutS2